MRREIDPFAIFAPPILTVICVILGYLHGRIIRRGKPLSSIQKKMLFYFAFFILGMGYAIMLQDQLAVLLHWRNAWIAVMVAWAALLAVVAWKRYRGNAPSQQAAAGDGGV